MIARAFRLTALLLALLSSAAAQADDAWQAVTGPGFTLQLPTDWELHRNAVDAPLLARPKDADSHWGAMQLLVRSQRYDAAMTCLDGQTQRQRRALEQRATPRSYREHEEKALTLDGHAAQEVVLDYRLGKLEQRAYLLTVADERRVVSALLTAPPTGFEFHRAALKRLVESLRVQPYAGAEFQPRPKS